MRRAVPVALAAVLLAAACGSAPRPARHGHAAVTALSYSQGAQICNDLSAWLPAAFSENQPRFTAQMRADEKEAGNTVLGTGLSILAANLQMVNGQAFFPPDGLGGLQRDCAAYGISISLPGG